LFEKVHRTWGSCGVEGVEFWRDVEVKFATDFGWVEVWRARGSWVGGRHFKIRDSFGKVARMGRKGHNPRVQHFALRVDFLLQSLRFSSVAIRERRAWCIRVLGLVDVLVFQIPQVNLVVRNVNRMLVCVVVFAGAAFLRPINALGILPRFLLQRRLRFAEEAIRILVTCEAGLGEQSSLAFPPSQSPIEGFIGGTGTTQLVQCI
jgi:hypothetical protein